MKRSSKFTSFALTTGLLPLLAASALAAGSFQADKVLTLEGKVEAANRYDHADFNVFNAGDGIVARDSGGAFQAANVTLKGVAYFDLDSQGMREALSKAGDQSVVLSVKLLQVLGKPRPLQVEYIGTSKDISSKTSVTRQFEAQPLARVNSALDQNSAPGTKYFDLSGITSKSLDKRWLVVRFEQQGLRTENTGQQDLYQFDTNPATVTLTLMSKQDASGKVTGHSSTVTGSGSDGNLLSDLPQNLLPDMPKDLTSDMPKDLTSDMPKDLTSDMPKDLTSDMPKNLIQD